MWQTIIVIAIIVAALAYVVRSLTRSARDRECQCGTAACALPDHHTADGSSLPCQNVSPAVPAESLEESARNLTKPAAQTRSTPR